MARGRHRPEVVTWDELGSGDGFPSFPGQRFLAEGDSWFSMSGVPAYNLLFEMRFHASTQIVNCALPGDTLVHMAELAKNRHYREALTTPGLTWKAILLSGGGNDLIDAADEILLPPSARPASVQAPADYCRQAALAALIEAVQQGFRRLAALRDAPGSNSPGVPIITHTYDYATPRNAPARFFFFKLGPWLYRALMEAQVPEPAWVPVADYLTDALAGAILALQKGPKRIANFHVVDTRGATRRAVPGTTGSSRDWQNEIHPNDDGYKRLALRIEDRLGQILD